MFRRSSSDSIIEAAQSVALTREAQKQTQAAIRRSIALLRFPVYPGDRDPKPEQ